MPLARCRRLAVAVAAACGWVAPAFAAPLAQASPAAPAAPAQSATRSMLDAQLFYQLLLAELELRAGQPGPAYQAILDAARRTRDERLFRRAVDIALQARAGDEALRAAEAWRAALPDSLDALRLQLQIRAALNRLDGAVEPLRALLSLTPAGQRAGLIAGLPQFFQRTPDPPRSAALLEHVLAPYVGLPETALAAKVALARAWLAARDGARALAMAREAHREDPAAPGPALVALELMASQPVAEAIVDAHLARRDAEPAVRIAYVRVLSSTQRYVDAVRQLEILTRERPALAQAWLMLGALHLELRHPAEAEQALLRHVALAEAGDKGGDGPGGAASDEADADSDGDGEAQEGRAGSGPVQAWLLLAQAAEQRGDLAAAEGWLAKVDDPARALEVQARRASLMARQGRVTQGRELIRGAPERSPADARAKVIAEAGLLRDLRLWQEAFDVLATAAGRWPADSDLLYEQAMMAEKLDRLAEMEALLRRVIEIKPDSAHAHNALGYSLADRRLRLPEARQFIVRALELAPGDPFITDSLGWVEYRMGNLPEALRLLRQAWAARPDPEIGAHLGEVLWVSGLAEEARRVWRESRARDATNDVLRETLARLRVDL